MSTSIARCTAGALAVSAATGAAALVLLRPDPTAPAAHAATQLEESR